MSDPTKKLLGATLAFVIGGPFFVALGWNLLLAGASQALTKSPRTGSRSRRTFKSTVEGEDEPIALIFGEVRAGGNLIDIETTSSGHVLKMDIAHCRTHGAGIESITDIWINDDRVADADIDASGNVTDSTYVNPIAGTTYLVNVERTLGASSLTTGAYVARTAIKINHDGSYTFHQAFEHGIPRVTALVRGIKCYDPRLDSTNGGSGTHRYNDVTTWAWTRNPALQAATYLIMDESVGGGGLDPAEDIDWAVIASSASICEESITVPDGLGGSTTQNRYNCDITLSTGDPVDENLEKIVSTMAGTIAYEDKVRIYAGDYDTPSFTIDESWLAGPIQGYSNKPPITQLYNAVKATYIDPGANYNTLESKPYTNSTYETADDGQRIWRTFNFEGAQDRYAVQYLCQIWGKRSRHHKTVVLPLNHKGVQLKTWDTVTLNLDEAGVNDVFRVMAMEFNDNGVTVTLLEENSDTYDVALADFTEVNPQAPAGELYETPAAPTNVTATATADGIDLTWANPGLSQFSEILIERATAASADGGTFTEIAGTKANSYRDPVTNGATYFYRLRARSPIKGNRYSDYTAEVSATAKVALAGGRGVNVMHPRYSTFEELSLPAVTTSNTTAQQDMVHARHGDKALRVSSTGTVGGFNYVVLASSSTDYNVILQSGKKYILSARARPSNSNMTAGLRVRFSDGTYSTLDAFELETAGEWEVLSTVIDLSSSTSTGLNVLLYNQEDGGGKYITFDAVMIEELAGNQTEPSAYVPPVGAVGNTQIAADSGQVADQRSLTGLVGGNQTPAVMSNDSALTGSDAGTTATISVDAHTRRYAEGTVSLNSGSVTGLELATKYYVYYDDQFFQGGSVTYAASTSSQAVAASKHRFYVGACTTPSDGGGTTSGGTLDCLALDMILEGGIAVRDVERGYSLEVMNDDAQFIGKRELAWKGETKTLPCVEIVTASASVICTHETPVICDRPGGALPAVAVEGQMVMTKVNGVNRWERVLQVKEAGEHEIVRMSFGGVSFPGGKEAAALIYTHNGEQKP